MRSVTIHHCVFACAAAWFAVGATPIRAENWPGWRGPTGRGYTTEKDLPLTWSVKMGENILWKAELHGGRKRNQEFASPGWSSPIVWGDHVFLTTAIWPAEMPQEEWRKSIGEHHVSCYRASDGEQLWDTGGTNHAQRQPDRRIYFASSGKTYVIQSGPEYKEMAVNDLNDHPDYTSAAISNGRIFIKGKSFPWCLGKK